MVMTFLYVYDVTVLSLFVVFTAPGTMVNLVDDAMSEDYSTLARRIAEATPHDAPLSDCTGISIVIMFIVRHWLKSWKMYVIRIGRKVERERRKNLVV